MKMLKKSGNFIVAQKIKTGIFLKDIVIVYSTLNFVNIDEKMCVFEGFYPE